MAASTAPSTVTVPSPGPGAVSGVYRARKEHSINAWATLFRRSWRTSMDYDIFESQAQRTFANAPLDHEDLFGAWASQIQAQKKVSARMLTYLDILISLDMIKETTILEVNTKDLKGTFAAAGKEDDKTQFAAEVGALTRLTNKTLQRIQSKTTKRRAPDVQMSTQLFKLIGLFAGAAVARGGIVTGNALALGEAVANFLVAHINDLLMTGVLAASEGGPPASLKAAFSKVVPTFVQVMTASGSAVADALTLLQQQSKLQEGMEDPSDQVAANDVDAMSFTHTAQPDVPIAPTRASIYAYLTTALTAAPKLDDLGLQVFLTARYHDDVSTMAVDLITAGFDILAGALERKEPSEVILFHKSFIANKLPAILEQLGQHPSFQSDGESIGRCITNAVKKVDENYRNTTVLQPGSDACPRQRFLLSCALFGFITEASVPTLLGYPPTQGLPSAGRYENSKLVQQCQADTKRIEQLVSDLTLMEGNAAAISCALLEIIRALCINRDSMTLRQLCYAFLKKPHAISIMLLFTDVRRFLHPLCQVLDNWQVPDDQEKNTLYDEFNTILLFILMCQYRYDLPLSSFTTISPDSFLVEYFQVATIPKHPKDITDGERAQLSAWTKGLFEKDSGLSDETLSTCTQKDFYKVVATLVDQAMVATQAGVLGIETAIGGMEFFLEAFLVPALVVVFSLFASRLSSMTADAPQLDFLMPLLTRLIKPQKLTPEAAVLHAAVLFISARPLWQSLSHIGALHRNRKDVGQVMGVLKHYMNKSFTMGAAASLLQEWCLSKNIEYSGVAGSFYRSLENLAKWNGPVKSVSERQAYNHRLTIYTVHAIGASQTLDILLDFASRSATNPKSTDQVLDTLTGLIVASTLHSSDHKFGLREALGRADIENAARSGSKDSFVRVQFISRLNRRVEQHCAKPLEQPPSIIPIITDAAMTDAADHAADIDSAAMVAAAASAVDIPMTNTQEMMMASLAEAAKGDEVSQQTQQNIPGGDLMNVGDMGDMQDMGLDEFLQDFNVSQTQDFDDIFSQM